MVKQKWGCIYRLTNTTNGMKYIGKTIRYRERMKEHQKKSVKKYISRAIRKYGWNKFKKEIIIDDVPEEDLDNLEQSYIEVENTVAPNGYNLTRGGGGTYGYTHKETSIKKMRQVRLKHHMKRKQFGCVYYNKEKKSWKVKSAQPECKYIGCYYSESKAREALKLYNATGKRMDPDRRIRKQGTGSIVASKHGTYYASITQNKETIHNTFKTRKEAEEFLDNCVKHLKSTGKQMIVDQHVRKKHTGTIYRRASGRYSARIIQNKKRKVGTFDTVEECEAFLENCRNNN